MVFLWFSYGFPMDFPKNLGLPVLGIHRQGISATGALAAFFFGTRQGIFRGTRIDLLVICNITMERSTIFFMVKFTINGDYYGKSPFKNSEFP